MKNLIVYYSYEGNTEELVKGMQEEINVDVLKLTPKKEKRTKSLFRFVWGGIQVYMTKNPERVIIQIIEYYLYFVLKSTREITIYKGA